MTTHREELAERSLGRLAELHGDVTALILGAYYARHPDARASFEHHGLGQTAELEGRMAAESLFLLLTWVEDPATARIDHGTAIVHHNDTLHVTPHWYLGMVDAALEVLLESIPPDCTDELALWHEVRASFAAFVESLRCEFLRSDGGAPLPDFAAPRARSR